MTSRKYIYRQDIATLLEVSVDVVRRNEMHWGLLDAREKLNDRTVRYKAGLAQNALRRFFQNDNLTV